MILDYCLCSSSGKPLPFYFPFIPGDFSAYGVLHGTFLGGHFSQAGGADPQQWLLRGFKPRLQPLPW